ncbi:MAG: hypothetical protein H0V88_05505 [Pyrinomonadaceae bacterium]|nr:hypothetical protein [Pyrinomonadaceae bacterium]
MNASQISNETVNARYRVLLTIWFVMLVSVGNFFLIAFFVAPKKGFEPEPNAALSITLAVLALAAVALSFVIKNKMLARAQAERSFERARTAYIVAMALSEMAGILGLVAHFAAGERRFFLWFIIAALALLWHKPRRGDLIIAS